MITHVGMAPVLWTSSKVLSAKLHHEPLVALGQLSVQCSPVALTQHLQRDGRICLRVLVIAQHGGQGAVAKGPFGRGRSRLLCFPAPGLPCWPAGLAIGDAGGAVPVPLRNCVQRRLRKRKVAYCRVSNQELVQGAQYESLHMLLGSMRAHGAPPLCA